MDESSESPLSPPLPDEITSLSSSGDSVTNAEDVAETSEPDPMDVDDDESESNLVDDDDDEDDFFYSNLMKKQHNDTSNDFSPKEVVTDLSSNNLNESSNEAQKETSLLSPNPAIEQVRDLLSNGMASPAKPVSQAVKPNSTALDKLRVVTTINGKQRTLVVAKRANVASAIQRTLPIDDDTNATKPFQNAVYSTEQNSTESCPILSSQKPIQNEYTSTEKIVKPLAPGTYPFPIQREILTYLNNSKRKYRKYPRLETPTVLYKEVIKKNVLKRNRTQIPIKEYPCDESSIEKLVEEFGKFCSDIHSLATDASIAFTNKHVWQLRAATVGFKSPITVVHVCCVMRRLLKMRNIPCPYGKTLSSKINRLVVNERRKIQKKRNRNLLSDFDNIPFNPVPPSKLHSPSSKKRKTAKDINKLSKNDMTDEGEAAATPSSSHKQRTAKKTKFDWVCDLKHKGKGPCPKKNLLTQMEKDSKKLCGELTVAKQYIDTLLNNVEYLKQQNKMERKEKSQMKRSMKRREVAREKEREWRNAESERLTNQVKLLKIEVNKLHREKNEMLREKEDLKLIIDEKELELKEPTINPYKDSKKPKNKLDIRNRYTDEFKECVKLLRSLGLMWHQITPTIEQICLLLTDRKFNAIPKYGAVRRIGREMTGEDKQSKEEQGILPGQDDDDDDIDVNGDSLVVDQPGTSRSVCTVQKKKNPVKKHVKSSEKRQKKPKNSAKKSSTGTKKVFPYKRPVYENRFLQYTDFQSMQNMEYVPQAEDVAVRPENPYMEMEPQSYYQVMID